jgi:hypothetical protein
MMGFGKDIKTEECTAYVDITAKLKIGKKRTLQEQREGDKNVVVEK